MSRDTFMTVARTMLVVFPEVTVWRGDFFPERPILALVGTLHVRPLDPDVVARRGREIAGRDVAGDTVRALTVPFYAGRLTATRDVVPPGPLNLDDRPVIEYTAPIAHRQQRTGETTWFTLVELIEFLEALLTHAPPERDPYPAKLDEATRGWVRGGFHRHAAAVYERLGQERLAADHQAAFEARVPPAFRVAAQEEPRD